MPIKVFRNYSLSSMLDQLENDSIQMLIIPDIRDSKKYTVSIDGEDYFVCEGFNEDFDLGMSRKDILEKWEKLKEFHALLESSGIQLGFLIDQYKKDEKDCYDFKYILKGYL